MLVAHVLHTRGGRCCGAQDFAARRGALALQAASDHDARKLAEARTGATTTTTTTTKRMGAAVVARVP